MRRIIHKHRHINAQSNHFMQSVCIAARIHWPQIDSRLYEWSFPAFVCESPHFCPVRTVTHSVHSSLFLGAAFRLHCNSQSVCYKMRACAVCCCIGAVSLGTLIEKWMVSSYSLCESPKKKNVFRVHFIQQQRLNGIRQIYMVLLNSPGHFECVLLWLGGGSDVFVCIRFTCSLFAFILWIFRLISDKGKCWTTISTIWNEFPHAFISFRPLIPVDY